ncbi:PREDICTED: ras-related protein Rab-21 [Papilio xuthus]|uniref:Ras-related protein Rab-21 n=1 Tax=Papilio xuthus TaxID=66420 RepID=A0A194PRP1_PAPXU|nr:PREDICTED: ras-related protein Rab-21 [Papilio xuthus]KPI96116.1 Ras-related protein Rab-21 [Papilio xuthus]
MSTARNGTHNFKVVLLGEGSVGKTSLLLRYVEDKFNERHTSTLQATFLNKKINLNDKRINLAIWDTAGQEKFHALGPIYYRNSNGAILVYDITEADSFVKVKNWVKELRRMLGSDIVLIIAGNKIDLEHEQAVPTEEAESFSKSVGAQHYYTSAKVNYGIEELFLVLAQLMLQKFEQGSQTNHEASRASQVLIVDDDEPAHRSCCFNSSRM